MPSLSTGFTHLHHFFFFFIIQAQKQPYRSCCCPLNSAETVTTSFIFPEYFTDLEGRKEQDPSLHWDFYSSSLFGRNPSCP